MNQKKNKVMRWSALALSMGLLMGCTVGGEGESSSDISSSAQCVPASGGTPMTQADVDRVRIELEHLGSRKCEKSLECDPKLDSCVPPDPETFSFPTVECAESYLSFMSCAMDLSCADYNDVDQTQFGTDPPHCRNEFVALECNCDL
jgi:hypothetical protein